MATTHYVKYRRPTLRQAETETGRRFLLRRAVLQWLLHQKDAPCAFGVDVPTGMTADRADLAAYWPGNVRTGTRKILIPAKTCAVVCALTRRECYAASINPDALVNELAALRRRLEALEAKIRQEEPNLRDSHSLFEEYADWDYEHSHNIEYQNYRARVREISEQLYHGTRMERIQRAQAADLLYLAIPEGTVFPEEVMPGWGVLTVSPDGIVTLERPAPPQNALAPLQTHLAQQIAIAASEYLRAGMGLRGKKNRQ